MRVWNVIVRSGCMFVALTAHSISCKPPRGPAATRRDRCRD